MSSPAFSRRAILGASGFALAAPFAAIMAAQSRAAEASSAGLQLEPAPSPFGPIAPVVDETAGVPLLQLPRGFTTRSYSWTGDRMDDGLPVAARHDGMAVVGTKGRDLLLIRNHEVRRGPPLALARGSYDRGAGEGAGGGCSLLRLRDGRLVEQRAVLGGTMVNCAGGPSLWNSWLSCEETVEDLSAAGGRPHGYVFDVSAVDGETSGVALTAMGRFRHEAVAFDPRTGHIFETEDDRNRSGFYRFRPKDPSRRYGALEAGGTLEAARVVGRPGLDLFATGPDSVRRVGETLPVEWVAIEEPDAPPKGDASGPFTEARAKGALSLSRGEGIWWDPISDCAYVVDTSFGVDAAGRPGRGLGGIWAYRPDRSDARRGSLTLVYAAAARVAGNNPDNITVSPRGGLVTVDDGDAVDDGFGPGNRIMGYLPDGRAYILGKNALQLSAADLKRMGRTGQFAAQDWRESELCGVCFSPDGRTMFLNIQNPGVTVAVSGPFARGGL